MKIGFLARKFKCLFLYFSEEIICKPENSRKLVQRKLDQPQDLKAPDIVTWLPVLLTASTSNSSSTSSSKLTNCSSAEPQTKSSTEKEQKPQPQNGSSSGQKTLEDGLVFRSPEMKRSLQRQKKKKLSKSKKQNTEICTDSDSETNNSDSFYETLRRHQRNKRKNSLKK